MAERAEQIGAHLEVESSPGAGTRTAVRVCGFCRKSQNEATMVAALTNQKRKIRVLIADDHVMVVAGLASIIGACSRIWR